MKIEIVTTPNEMLRETGFGSVEACHSVLESIRKYGHAVSLNVCKTEEELHFVANKQPDLVVLAVKYLSIENGKDIWLSDYFEKQNINYSGSVREVLEFDSDKVSAKHFLNKKGVKTARYFTATPGQFSCENELPFKFPLFLKPVDAANGNGIDDSSLVNSFDEYEKKLSSLYQTFKRPALVEEYLCGQEFTVAIINSRELGLYTSIVEIVPPRSLNGLRILGEKAKREDTETFKKTQSSELTQSVRKLAIDAFKLLKVRDFARIDIKANELGECFFMEANLVPGLTTGSSYLPKAFAMTHGFNYDTVIHMLIDGGISRARPTLTAIKDYCRHQPVPSATRSRRLLEKCAQMLAWR
jgi:D-alanine-D-alanine ligase